MAFFAPNHAAATEQIVQQKSNVELAMSLGDIMSADCEAITKGVDWDAYYVLQHQIDQNDALHEIYLKQSSRNRELLSTSTSYADDLCLAAALDAEALGLMR